MWHSLTPGSGKSTWVQKKLENESGIWCSRDAVRFSMVKEDEDYFAKEDDVFNTWISNIQEAIDNKNYPDNIYVDATHLTPRARKRVINSLKLRDAELGAVNFHVNLGECLRRNNLREGRANVPESVIRKMAKSFIPASIDEVKYIIDIYE